MRLDRILAVLLTVAVLALGLGYVATRSQSYESHSQVVLVPVTTAKDAPTVFDSFTSAGTLGTLVELLSSPDLAAKVGAPEVTFAARAVPDSRVVGVTATGPEAAVQPALSALLANAKPAQKLLADSWTINTLVRPTVATPGGPATPMLILVVVALAILAGSAVLLGARRLVPDLAGRRLHLPRPHRRRPRVGASTPVPKSPTS